MEYVESYVEGPRWLDIEGALQRAAARIGLPCKTDTSKGVFRKKVFYRLDGERKKLVDFRNWMGAFISENNK